MTRIIRQCGHNCILHIHRHFLRKVIFPSKNSSYFSWFSESELQICGFLEKSFCYRCQNCILRCWRIFFHKNKTNFVQKKILTSFGFCDCFSYSCRHCYGRIAKISLCMFRRTIWRICHLESLSFFLRFRIPSKSFQKFDEKFLTRLSQLHSACPDEDFFHFLKEGKERKFSFRKSCIAIFFRLWTKKILSVFCKHG